MSISYFHIVNVLWRNETLSDQLLASMPHQNIMSDVSDNQNQQQHQLHQQTLQFSYISGKRITSHAGSKSECTNLSYSSGKASSNSPSGKRIDKIEELEELSNEGNESDDMKMRKFSPTLTSSELFSYGKSKANCESQVVSQEESNGAEGQDRSTINQAADKFGCLRGEELSSDDDNDDDDEDKAKSFNGRRESRNSRGAESASIMEERDPRLLESIGSSTPSLARHYPEIRTSLNGKKSAGDSQGPKFVKENESNLASDSYQTQPEMEDKESSRLRRRQLDRTIGGLEMRDQVNSSRVGPNSLANLAWLGWIDHRSSQSRSCLTLSTFSLLDIPSQLNQIRASERNWRAANSMVALEPHSELTATSRKPLKARSSSSCSVDKAEAYGDSRELRNSKSNNLIDFKIFRSNSAHQCPDQFTSSGLRACLRQNDPQIDIKRLEVRQEQSSEVRIQVPRINSETARPDGAKMNLIQNQRDRTGGSWRLKRITKMTSNRFGFGLKDCRTSSFEPETKAMQLVETKIARHHDGSSLLRPKFGHSELASKSPSANCEIWKPNECTKIDCRMIISNERHQLGRRGRRPRRNRDELEERILNGSTRRNCGYERSYTFSDRAESMMQANRSTHSRGPVRLSKRVGTADEKCQASGSIDEDSLLGRQQRNGFLVVRMTSEGTARDSASQLATSTTMKIHNESNSTRLKLEEPSGARNEVSNSRNGSMTPNGKEPSTGSSPKGHERRSLRDSVDSSGARYGSSASRRASFNFTNVTNSSSSNQTNRFYKFIESRRKAAKMLIVIVIMFGLCYLPVHFLNTLR